MVQVEIPIELRRPEAVRDALQGRESGILSPSLALAMVPDLDIPKAQQLVLLEEALTNSDLEPRVRALAVGAYARAAGASAIRGLLDVLNQPGLKDEVAARAVHALGRLGTPEELQRLKSVEESASTGLLSSWAAFAQAMIVHRFGVTEVQVDLPDVDLQEPRQAKSGALLPWLRGRVGIPGGEVIEGVRQEFPHVNSRTYDVYELHCGRQLVAIVVDKRFLSRRGVQQLGRRPALPAFIAYVNHETGRFFPALVVLTRPQDSGRATVVIARTTGEPVFGGSGSLTRSGAEIELAAARAPGVAAVAARVRASDEGLEITGVSERRALPGSIPERTEPPSPIALGLPAVPRAQRRSARSPECGGWSLPGAAVGADSTAPTSMPMQLLR